LEINNHLIKHYLRNVLFITGTAYAGKTTMAKMLSDKYGLILCAENYDCVPDSIITKENYLACMAKVNSREFYDTWADSGFFTLVRKDTKNDTRQETLEILARHFELFR